MIWGCMSVDRPGKMAITFPSVSAHVYINILTLFSIPLKQNRFGDDELIFQDHNASCLKAER